MIPAGRHFGFHPRALPFVQADRRPLEYTVARWVLAHGGDALLAETAARASLADGAGDSALRIDDASTRELLTASAMVGDADSNGTPFVLDGDLFYLRRNFAHELAVSAMLRARLADEVIEADTDLEGLFDSDGGETQSGQTKAVELAIGRRLFVLTGGPGTGKTTTVMRLLMAASRKHAMRHEQWPHIALAAPTGKAARRLGESLRCAVIDDFSPDWQATLAHVQSTQPGTLHALLRSRGQRGGYGHDAKSPLDADIVVVDEASMLDLALLRALLTALRPDACLLLVGDADQLDSVGTGSVLQDIVAALDSDDAHLQRLQYAYRADPALRPLNEAVRIGDVAAFDKAMSEAGDQVTVHAVRTSTALEARLDAWCEVLLAEYRAHGMDQPIDPRNVATVAGLLDIANRRQLLCALREGSYGASGLNAAIETSLAPALQDEALPAGAEPWYPGRRILITRNDASSGLLNGDVGLCLKCTEGRLQVWFDGDDDAVPRAFDIAALPPHQPAFALTVHKAQGSEYDEVAVVLPPRAEHPLLSRQWFYTAISRARRRLQIWGDVAAIARAIEFPARRSSGLARRIRTVTSTS